MRVAAPESATCVPPIGLFPNGCSRPNRVGPRPDPLDPVEDLRRLDHAHFWHPFTQMADWCASEEDPLVLVSGRGAILTDAQGRDYFDGNSSIWTNLHGHRHP